VGTWSGFTPISAAYVLNALESWQLFSRQVLKRNTEKKSFQTLSMMDKVLTGPVI